MKYPRKVQIGFQEGTCPLRCKKCPYFGDSAPKVREVEKMPLDKAKRIIDEISEMEVIPTVQPHIQTEPFANEDLKEIIAYCYKKNVPLSIITNGLLLNRDWMDFLIKQLDRESTVSFSLDAITQETYEKVRGAYSLALIENNIQYMIENRGDQGPRISVNFTYETDNFDEKEIFLEKWKNRVDAVRISVALDSDKKVPSIFRKQDIIKENRVCPYLDEVLVIDAGGEVRICSTDTRREEDLGNAFEMSLMSIWNGRKRKELLQRQKEGKLVTGDVCFGCEWGYSIYGFNKIEETEEFTLKIADYSIYYNNKTI